MSTQDKLQLGWGASAYVPEGAPAAWGARLIYPNDLVWDRQDMQGEPSHRAALSAWLNGTDTHAEIGALRLALDKATELDLLGGIRGSMNTMVVLHDDTAGRIVGNPNASYGYLYVAGWLRGDWWNEEVIPGFPDTAILTAQAKDIVSRLTEPQILGLDRLGSGARFDSKSDRNERIRAHASLEKMGLVQSDWFWSSGSWGGTDRKELSCQPTLLGRFVKKMLDRSLLYG